MPLLPQLVSPEEPRGALSDERMRVFDVIVFLRRAVNGGPYAVESGRVGYARVHLPSWLRTYRRPSGVSSIFRRRTALLASARS